jgi:hypothetical protein
MTLAIRQSGSWHCRRRASREEWHCVGCLAQARLDRICGLVSTPYGEPVTAYVRSQARMEEPWRTATCPTDIVHGSPERVWELLTNRARLDWVGVKLVEAPARRLAVGDRLVFGPRPGCVCHGTCCPSSRCARSNSTSRLRSGSGTTRSSSCRPSAATVVGSRPIEIHPSRRGASWFRAGDASAAIRRRGY